MGRAGSRGGICVGAWLCAAVCLLGAAPAHAVAPIEGTWKSDDFDTIGKIVVTPSGAGAWVGTITEPGDDLCSHPVGRQVWQINPGDEPREYVGSHTWTRVLTCEPIGEGSATFKVGYSRDRDDAGVSGAQRLKLCTINPEYPVFDERCGLFHQTDNPLVVRDEDGCEKLRSDQAWHASFSGQHVFRGEPVPGTPGAVSEDVQRFPIGSAEIRADGCRKGRGRWGITDSVDVTIKSWGLDDLGRIREAGPKRRVSKGWGIGVRASALGSLEIGVQRCERGDAWETLQELSQIPVPGLSDGFSIAQYLAGKFIDLGRFDDVTCPGYGSWELELDVRKSGRVVLERGFDATEIARETYPQGNFLFTRETRVLEPKIKPGPAR